jgi:organic radical activating enzyme
MGSLSMTKQCVLMQHGLSLVANCNTGICCYNHNNPRTYSSLEIDPVGCKACIDQENNNIKSYRQGANEQYGLLHDHLNPIVLDFVPNFNCNLTCKICNEHSSSSWAKLKQIKIHTNYNVSISKFKSVFEAVDLSNVREINFSGGEPLLNNSILKYISTLENRIDFSKCTLRFSTNATIPLNIKISEFFLKFKLVLARFSIDDIDTGFEYQRYPATWNQCQTNWQLFLDKMPHNAIPSINRTVSVLNIRRLQLLDQWHAGYLTTRFGDSIELIDHFASGDYSLNHMPLALKQDILSNGSTRARDYVDNREPSNNTTGLQTAIQQHDMMHNTALQDFDPDLYRFIFQ